MRPIRTAAITVFLFAVPARAQVYVPIPVTGFTQDVIADAVGVSMATTTTSFDQPTSAPPVGYVLYEQGYNTAFPGLGIPSDGLIATSPTRSYQLGPITGYNSLQLSDPAAGGGPAVLSGTLTLGTPARYAALSLLLADGSGNQPSHGGFEGTLAVNWSNGNTTDYIYTVYDWFLLSGTPAPNSGVAIAGLDRAAEEAGTPQNNMTNPTLFYYDIDLSADANYLGGALVDSVTAMRQPGNFDADVTNIMGLTGSATVPEPSALLLVSAAIGAGFARRARRRSTNEPK